MHKNRGKRKQNIMLLQAGTPTSNPKSSQWDKGSSDSLPAGDPAAHKACAPTVFVPITPPRCDPDVPDPEDGPIIHVCTEASALFKKATAPSGPSISPFWLLGQRRWTQGKQGKGLTPLLGSEVMSPPGCRGWTSARNCDSWWLGLWVSGQAACCGEDGRVCGKHGWQK